MKYNFKMFWSFNGEQEEHYLVITVTARSENEAFALAAVNAVQHCEKRGAHVVELTYMNKEA